MVSYTNQSYLFGIFCIFFIISSGLATSVMDRTFCTNPCTNYCYENCVSRGFPRGGHCVNGQAPNGICCCYEGDLLLF
ncbi:transmembrane protein, putative [Medicago truncatula]|uniref:Transmembrane protein, putative n=1 Tax=Medicago truncatula TaxID=3880 RepID=G7IGR2_MEDTR|nr:transmembrane protein, putative [Medicago truncatula]